MENAPLNESDGVQTHETNAAEEPKTEPAVESDSGQGQVQQGENVSNLTPRTGSRQRKKNSKYLDFENELFKKQRKKSPVKKSPVEGETAVKTPSKRGRAKKVPAPEADQDQEEIKTPPQKSEKAPKKAPGRKKAPVKKARVKKARVKKAPAKKTPAKEDGESTVETGGVESDQQKTETVKPKKKYMRKVYLSKDAPSPTDLEDQKDAPITTEAEIAAGGRPRRSAAKEALKYLQSLAKEVQDELNSSGSQPDSSDEDQKKDQQPSSGQKVPKAKAGGKRQKRRGRDDSDNSAKDEDFCPDDEEQGEEEMTEELESEFESDDEFGGRYSSGSRLSGSMAKHYGKAANGLPNYIMRVAIDSAKTNKKFREEHCSSWVFPEWIPSVKHWHIVQESEREKYLPQELQSAGFKISREGIRRGAETPLQRLSRFETLPPHPERWDMFMFVGGPVWAMEWCPTPDGATASQYVALACHRGMDDQHLVNKTYPGPGLIQLWELGTLEYDTRPESPPALSYCLAQNKGFVWQLKWCPAGAWEPPTCNRNAPFLPRLGLLAVGTSTGVVTIYSMPHPDALNSSKMLPDSGELTQGPPIYQAEGVITLRLSSQKGSHHDKSGQVLSMDWVFDKPHNIMAVGFYDGIVGLWDLSNKSTVLCECEPDNSITLLPYRCFFAHDNAVRSMAFCPASRYLLVTAGDDRLVKTWDLKRIYEPNTVHKRNLTTEIYWPVRAPGLLMSQEGTYASHRQQGVHYYDMGYYSIRSFFVAPRTTTMWSLCFTDWLNSLVTSDTVGELIFAVLPELATNTQTFRRLSERRFPVFFTDMVPYETNTTEEDSHDMEEVGENVTETEGAPAGAERERDNTPGEVTTQEREENGGPNIDVLLQDTQTYKDAAKKYYLHYTDSNMSTFNNYVHRPPWKRMSNTEVYAKIDLDILPLAALHKVCFNPNMSSHTWIVSGGQAGLVRAHCLRNMNVSEIRKIINVNKAEFDALYVPEDKAEEKELISSPQTVHSTTGQQ